MRAYYIILEDRVVLDAKDYPSWREIQAAYPDYTASLGPWTKAELLDYLRDDFGAESDWPLSLADIDTFYAK